MDSLDFLDFFGAGPGPDAADVDGFADDEAAGRLAPFVGRDDPAAEVDGVPAATTAGGADEEGPGWAGTEGAGGCLPPWVGLNEFAGNVSTMQRVCVTTPGDAFKSTMFGYKVP